jgi:outer membrane protein
MGPIRDKIYEATMKVVRERKLDFIFDKASDFVMIYADPRHDYSDYVLDILGLGEKDDAVKKK